jgi:hypothetical protein
VLEGFERRGLAADIPAAKLPEIMELRAVIRELIAHQRDGVRAARSHGPRRRTHRITRHLRRKVMTTTTLFAGWVEEACRVQT